ncbi:uncharacterized protein LOC122385262 [Amphibalanus amphitrite]|uniref:uncharacterized protein LOC122385262 n=1 Tax=Amphibalanus amphitrite TaxID=1232801 RepID=UPI001C929134|nr:uncharacterized protein LOC122385262 [Amphibalanus amphitrite]
MSLSTLLVAGAVPFAGRGGGLQEPQLVRDQLVSQLGREIVSAFRMVSGGSPGSSAASSRRSSTDASVQVDDEPSQCGRPLPDIIRSSLPTDSAPMSARQSADRPCGRCRGRPTAAPAPGAAPGSDRGPGAGLAPPAGPAPVPAAGAEDQARPRAYTDSAAVRSVCHCLRNKVHQVSEEFEALLLKRLAELEGREDRQQDVLRQTGALLRQIADDLQHKLSQERKEPTGAAEAPVAAALERLTGQVTLESCLWTGIAVHICVTLAQKLP